jgi:hypothetical protein
MNVTPDHFFNFHMHFLDYDECDKNSIFDFNNQIREGGL